ncbi:MAG: VCBS repeat-containing protein [Myxococcota bacterium]
MTCRTVRFSVLSVCLLVACGDDGAGGEATSVDPTLATQSGTQGDTSSGGGGSTAATAVDDDSTTGDDTAADSTGISGQACMSSAQCPDGQACAANECVPTDGDCETDFDCDVDTYCCAADCLPPDESGGVCIPYGEGPRGDVNEECTQEVVIGLFEPSVQCEWTAPVEGDPFPDHVNVLTTPLVANLPNDSGAAAEIIIVTYNGTDGGSSAAAGADPSLFGVIRVLNGQTCEVIENIHDPANAAIAASPPAIADLDADGTPEIVTQRAGTGLVAYKWNGASFQTFWTATNSSLSAVNRWDGPAIHDLDGDMFPEVITGTEVYSGLDGTRLNPGQAAIGYAGPGEISVLGDVDVDGTVELIVDDVYGWEVATAQWVMESPGGIGGQHYGFADFGTPGATPEAFDDTAFDGIAEIVTVASGTVYLHTLDGQEIMAAPINVGGPPTVGDFDNDGRPEIAAAGGTEFVVYDLDCAGGVAGCAAPFIRWTQPSQDSSSARTGSSIFDFECDGQAEAVYGDECFVRVYEGDTGEVLYSAARTSCTWYENPIVADPDLDENTEILVGSNVNCNISCPEVDPIHRGVRCEDDAGCGLGTCMDGFCRCTVDEECFEGHSCETPLPGTPPGGNTCRAIHPPGIAISGVRVLRDRLDRWASSRPLWNQHAYSITNINDDMTVPPAGAWPQNFTDGELNNYRQNRQGPSGAEDLPDITGKLEETACTFEDAEIVLNGTVCNRGLKPVAAALPATFYQGEDDTAPVLCVAFTAEPVPVGECREVSCPIGDEVTGVITMVVNDDGMGGALTVECNSENNTDQVEILECTPPA